MNYFDWIWRAPRWLYRRSRSALEAHVHNLRESAIEPLPQPERLPRALRELEWKAGDPAGTVRRLRGTTEAAKRNDLGCAFAVLAAETGHDRYWLNAIAELQAASKGGSKPAKRAARNLEAVRSVARFAERPAAGV